MEEKQKTLSATGFSGKYLVASLSVMKKMKNRVILGFS